MNCNNCYLLDIPKISDQRGNLSFLEGSRHVPFDIKRVYYLYDIPGGSERGGHAHKSLEQVLIALAGSFDVELDDGIAKKVVRLGLPFKGLYISSGIWRVMTNFSSGAVCLVLASDLYYEDDYYRDYNEFLDSKIKSP